MALSKPCQKWGFLPSSYRGAQIFEAIGLNQNLIDTYFTKTASRVEGIGLDGISRDIKTRHLKAYLKETITETKHLTQEVSTNGVQAGRSICLTLLPFINYRKQLALVIMQSLKNILKSLTTSLKISIRLEV